MFTDGSKSECRHSGLAYAFRTNKIRITAAKLVLCVFFIVVIFLILPVSERVLLREVRIM